MSYHALYNSTMNNNIRKAEAKQLISQMKNERSREYKTMVQVQTNTIRRAGEMAELAIERLGAILYDENAKEADVIKAAKTILEYSVGSPKTVELLSEAEAKVIDSTAEVVDEFTIEELDSVIEAEVYSGK